MMPVGRRRKLEREFGCMRELEIHDGKALKFIGMEFAMDKFSE
jgi:hypothetical protein